MSKLIYVYSDWDKSTPPQLMGELHANVIRGKEIFSFHYNKLWLAQHTNFILDPALQMFEGPQYPAATHTNFGIFLDSTPDRFGRLLMARRAKFENKHEKLFESDYLLGVFDASRMGALRFKLAQDGPFLDDNKNYAIPPFTSLRELEAASLALEQNDAANTEEYKKWLQLLVVHGSSLGGARPKASVIDHKQHLWIAKFPSSHDEIDIGGWELLAHNLAEKSGITISSAKIQCFNSTHHTFLTKRFDRNDYGQRIHFASAMTLLQHTDGDNFKTNTSYLEIVEFLTANGANSNSDLLQLWRRIVFYICISNVDDHLRNHGFILEPNIGWRLSPAYDINPVRNGNGLTLNINEDDNSQDLSLAIESAHHFRISQEQAKTIIEEIVNVVKKWPAEASKLSISRQEQEHMSRAFRIADSY